MLSLAVIKTPVNLLDGLFVYATIIFNGLKKSVTGVLKRNKQYDNSKSYYRYKRNQRQQNQNESEQTFHVELQIMNVGDRKHVKLAWKSFFISTVYRSSTEENINHFELNNASYPPLIYSRVKSYAAFSTAPLE